MRKHSSYDRLIQFRRAQVVDSGFAKREGAFVNLWDPVPARFVPGVGAERFANEQNVATAPSIFAFMWCPELADLTPADEILDGVITWAIKSVLWDGRTNLEVEVAAVRKYGK